MRCFAAPCFLVDRKCDVQPQPRAEGTMTLGLGCMKPGCGDSVPATPYPMLAAWASRHRCLRPHHKKSPQGAIRSPTHRILSPHPSPRTVTVPPVPVVDAMEHHGNRRQRVERLISAWGQASRGTVNPTLAPDDPLIATSAEPRRRTRTQLTAEQVDAMRTARTNGVGVSALAHQFGVHRATVWAKTRLVWTVDGEA